MNRIRRAIDRRSKQYEAHRGEDDFEIVIEPEDSPTTKERKKLARAIRTKMNEVKMERDRHAPGSERYLHYDQEYDRLLADLTELQRQQDKEDREDQFGGKSTVLSRRPRDPRTGRFVSYRSIRKAGHS